MHSESEMRQALREWILGKAEDLDPAALTGTTPLFEERHLRSLHVPELLLLLDRLRGEPIDVDDLGAGDFRDIDTLMAKFGPARTSS
jgi:hypothetical protein